MNAAAKSVCYFGVYMLVAGSGFLVAPDRVLPLLRLPATTEVWIRVVGLLMVLIGFYYVMAGRAGLQAFFPWTVITRCVVLVAAIAFVVLGFAGPSLLAVGGVDFIGAMWTLAALRKG